mmetsp:Transcript_6449/g.11526  ORF Transcript_6449/g.11526 Transcript_6449/m.11526 type:complete len:321 (-) Transcript_6449:32-994(-)
MKSNNGKFEKYGDLYEGLVGCVITCLLDRQERRHSISYCLNGKNLGVAFRLPSWMAEVPLFPALCGREDWRAILRFRDLRYPHGGFRDLAEASNVDILREEGADLAAASVFAAAPFVETRELQEFDVPDENIVELRREGVGNLDGHEIRKWLLHEHGIIKEDFHSKLSEDGRFGVFAFTTHRVARSIVAAPPQQVKAVLRGGFSEEAQAMLAAERPDKATTTDAVARRLIAGALDGDTVLSRDQLRQIRAKPQKKPPPAPPMPASDDEESSEKAKETELKKMARPSRLLAGALQGLGGTQKRKAGYAEEKLRSGPRNALF